MNTAVFVQALLDLGFGVAALAWLIEGTWTAITDVRAVAREQLEKRRRRRTLAHLEDYRIGPGVSAP